MKRKILRNQRGFTLIEIIAVLIILGILAAVAIPKFLSVQEEARGMALSAAIYALQSTAAMDYSKGLLNGMYSTNTGPTATSGVTVGDFTGSYTTGGNVTVTVTGGPTNWEQLPAGTNKSKDFKLY